MPSPPPARPEGAKPVPRQEDEDVCDDDHDGVHAGLHGNQTEPNARYGVSLLARSSRRPADQGWCAYTVVDREFCQSPSLLRWYRRYYMEYATVPFRYCYVGREMRAPTGGKPKSAPWLAGLLLAALGGLAASSAAEARGFVGFGFGVPLGPPAYYYPPPQAYAPPSAVGDESGQDQTCREYQSTTTIDGRPQASYGTACLQ